MGHRYVRSVGGWSARAAHPLKWGAHIARAFAFRRHISGTLSALSDALFSALRWLYLTGPDAILWGGAAAPDVCASMTGVGAEHWRSNAVPCENLIDRKATAFGLSIVITLAAYAVLLCGAGLCIRMSLVDPICASIRTASPRPPQQIEPPERKMGSTSLLLVIVAVAVLGAMAALSPCGRSSGARASDDAYGRRYDEGLKALVAVIERWMREARTSRPGPDPRRFSGLAIPAPVLSRMRGLTRLDRETAGVLACSERGPHLIANSISERPGDAMSSTVPDGLVSYHTHATPAYASGNPVNYPSPHDALGVLALGLPGRGNAGSLVAAREGIYGLRADPGLIEHISRSAGSEGACAADCSAIATAVQRAVDAHSASGDIGAYCSEMRGAGFRCDFRAWPAGDGHLAFGLR